MEIYDLVRDKIIWSLEMEDKKIEVEEEKYKSCSVIECDNWNSKNMRCSILKKDEECLI